MVGQRAASSATCVLMLLGCAAPVPAPRRSAAGAGVTSAAPPAGDASMFERPSAPPFVAGSDAAEAGTDAAFVPSAGVRYMCPEPAVGEQRPGRPTHPAVIALLAAARRLDAIHPDSLTGDPSAALAEAAALDFGALTTFERIVAQNAAVTIALASNPHPGTFEQATGIIERSALNAVELERLGERPDRSIEAWIGAEQDWIDRKGPACGKGRTLVHEQAARGTRAFRPVRVGGRRALIAQLVALDTEGAPHITPVIASIEIRRGLDAWSPACLVELSPEALSQGVPSGLAAVPYQELRETRFVRPQPGGRVKCSGCHTGRNGVDFEDVPARDATVLGAGRRAAVLALARGALDARAAEIVRPTP